MSHGFANAIYYPSWKVYSGKPPSSLNVGQASHVFYAFVGYERDGYEYPMAPLFLLSQYSVN